MRSIFRTSVTASLLILTLVFAACQAWKEKQPEADLELIYKGAAQRKDIHRNAVIVIPGIMGSRLTHGPSEQIVWGAFTRDAANPRDPEAARLFALPMAKGTPLNQLTDSVKANGALDRLKISVFSGFSIQPKAYLQIMEVLGVGGFRDESLQKPSSYLDYGPDHYNCFQFPYDWRRSSAENAVALGQFVRKKKAYIEAQNLKYHGTKGKVKFNIVAHSMGGMVARYYLRYGEQGMPTSGKPTLNWAGAKDVEKVILVGPPNAGSALMLQQHVEGLDLGPFTFKYPASLIGTMPSTYELLPRARHRVLKDTVKVIDLDPLDPQVWIDYQWGLLDPKQSENLAILLPHISSAEERTQIAQDHLVKCLRNARNFQESLDSPATPPSHVRMVLFAGDAVATAVQAEAWMGSVKLVGYSPGDDTVARYSALMDERFADRNSSAPFRSPISWDQVTFLTGSHIGLTKSQTFADNVLFELLEKK